MGGGNPINLINGNKYQEETDLFALPGVLGLELKRYYNSQSSHPGLLGANWRMSYETVLYDFGSQIQIVQADGRRLVFQRGVGQNAALCSSAQPQDGQVRIEAAKDVKSQPTYHWRWPDGRTLTFTSGSGGGYPLQAITASSGERLTLSYSPTGELATIRDPQGRKLSFIYASAAEKRSRALKAIDTPLGRISYSQDALGRLTQVTNSKDAASASHLTRLYHYEDRFNASNKQALTGISVLRLDPQTQQPTEQRQSTFAYNAAGLAILSTKGLPKALKDGQQVAGTGIEQIEVAYVEKALPREASAKVDRATGEVTPAQSGKSVLTNSLGQTSQITSAVIGGHFRLIEMRGPGCSTCGPANMRYSYSSQGQLLRSTRLDDQGRAVSSEVSQYDGYGRLARTGRQPHEAGGKPLAVQWLQRFEYDDVRFKDGTVAVAPHPSLIAQPSVFKGKERITRLAYNELGQPTRITEEGFSPFDDKSEPSAVGFPISRFTSYRYQVINGRSVIVEIDGPLPNGPKRSSEDSDITRLAWDANGDRLTGMTHPMGLTASFKYDEIGRLVQSVGVDGIPIGLRYEAGGSVSMVDSAGAVSRLTYDASGRLNELIDPLGQRLKMSYDVAGKLALVGDAQNNRIALQRSSEGDLLKAELLNPDGSVSQRREFGAGALQDPVLSSMRRLIDNAEDNIARPAFASAPAAALRDISARRDLDGPRSATTTALDVNDGATTYFKNDFDHLVAVRSPTTGLTRYSYNAAGQVTLRQQADGSRTAYERDGAGRVVTIRSTDPRGVVDENATVTWGKANKPSRISYLAGEEQFAYDDAARLIEHTQRTDAQRFSLKYRYDNAGRLLTKTLPDGQVLSFRYRDSQHPRAGLLESVWLQGPIDRPIVEGMNSDADRYQLRSFHFGNGLTSKTLLDSQGRIVQAGNAQVGQTQLSYAQAATSSEGNASSPPTVQQAQSVLPSRRAQAESAQRLITQVRGTTAGWLNASSAREVSGSAGLGVPASNAGTGAFEDDALGRKVAQGAVRFVYDSLNRLVEVKHKTGTGDEAVTAARYRYNVFGQRVAKVVYGADGTAGKVTYFFHDGSELAAEASADESGLGSDVPVAVQYLQLNGKPVAMLKPGRLGSTGLYFVHTDHRNAPLALTDEARQVVWQAQVGDYGLTQIATGNAVGFNLRASNQYFDDETGLHYNTNRYFDPVAQRYLTPDPMGLAVGPDLYAFALNRPHEFTDPLGLAPITQDADVPKATFADKLKYVFERVAKKYPGEVGQALLEMVQPGPLLTTAAIFGVWAVAQATPVGWAADVVILGIGYFTLGKAIYDVLDTLVSSSIKIYNANCLTDLEQAADVLGKGLATASVNVGIGGAAAGAPKIAGLIRQLLKKAPSGKLPGVPQGPKAPPPAPIVALETLGSLEGKQLFGPKLTNVATKNDGVLGEQIAAQILKEKTGGTYRGIHNGSGNGPDLIRINPTTKTIEHIEVKSSQTGKPGWPTGSGTTRFNDWITEAANLGTIAGKKISPADQVYATQIQKALAAGFKLENKVMQVSIPAPKTSGSPIAELFNW